MHEQEEIARQFFFISGAGKAAEKIRNYSWEKTSLGLPGSWPVPLKTALSLMLKIDAPMYLVWGTEQIRFCNDALLELMPDAEIGDKVTLEKEQFQSLIDQSQGNGLVSIQGFPFTVSPVYDENGATAGLMAVPSETRNHNESLFYELITQAPVGIAILKGSNHVFTVANDKYLELVDRKRMSLLGKPILEALPEIEGQGVEELLDDVLRTGTPFIGNEFRVDLRRHGKTEGAYFNFVYSPFRTDNAITGVMVVAMEVSDLVKSRKTVEESEKQLREMIMQSPIPVTIFRGPDFVVEMANKVMFESVWRKKPEEVLNRKLLDVFPELYDQKYPELLNHVYETGLAHRENESIAIVAGSDGEKVFYLDYEYAPLFDHENKVSGILITVNDVSEKVLTRQKIEESETRQKIAIESAEIGTFDWDIAHSEFIYSERLALIFGYKETKGLKHNNFINLIHPDDVGLRTEAHKDSFKTGKLFYEARFIKADDSICWLRLNGKVFFDDKGHPHRMYGTVLDITSQKLRTEQLEKEVLERTQELLRKNEELKRSEEKYHRMTDEVQDYAIILLSADGKIMNWNKGAEKIKGYSESETIGKDFSIFYLQEDRQRNLPGILINEARTTGRATHEGWRVRKDGSIFWASIVITALHDDDDNIIGFSKVTRDLTERKIAEDRLRQYTTELEFQNKELEQFAYIASHDLQEPLRKIQTFSSMLGNNLENRQATELYLGKIKSSAERMTDLIKAVLNYSRLSSTAIGWEKIDLNQMIESIKVDFELMIAEKNARIIYDELPQIEGISLQLTQLFSNLIGNSLKFSSEDPEIRITWRYILDQEVLRYPNLQTGTRYVELVFQDNGIGFDKQYAGQIFNMFQRLHDKQSYSGTGIGLALCKRIVENHHGYISASSEPGNGARFNIYLPV